MAGFDAAIDYKSEDIGSRLSALCPNGIDVFFDNVGGVVLNEVPARITSKRASYFAARSRDTTRPYCPRVHPTTLT